MISDPTIPLLTVYQDRKLGVSTRDMHKSVHTGREIQDDPKAHLQESGWINEAYSLHFGGCWYRGWSVPPPWEQTQLLVPITEGMSHHPRDRLSFWSSYQGGCHMTMKISDLQLSWKLVSHGPPSWCHMGRGDLPSRLSWIPDWPHSEKNKRNRF